MHEELVNALRETDFSDGCPCVSSEMCKNKDCIILQAADAIEELSAKATPKMVGFASWKGCRDTRYKCQLCTKYVRNDEKYCHKCGQALMFPIISFTPYVPGKRQETIISWPDEPLKEEEHGSLH